ncbi:MAG: S1 RNA-binding domain-containing protein, partial [Haloarculaceae archaeon]
MGKCIICGRDVDGRICQSHEEDVVFEYRGSNAGDLVPGRFYRGVVDGYADFGVFVDISSNVTGLLHRSELDRRLESLDWEPGDEVFVQVKNVRDNGNIDLTWSIRQQERDFRGVLIQEGTAEHLPEEGEEPAEDEEEPAEPETERSKSASAAAESSAPEPEAVEGEHRAGAEDDGSETETEETEAEAEETEAEPDESEFEFESESESEEEPETREEPEPAGDRERVEIGTLSNRVGETVRIEGEVVGARQTGGPTVFELRDESGVV